MLCNSAITTCNNAVICFNNAICRTKTLLDRYNELHFWGVGGGGGATSYGETGLLGAKSSLLRRYIEGSQRLMVAGRDRLLKL